MANSIKLTESQWSVIKKQLSEEYPPSVLLIRACMRRALGFTTRTHHTWAPYYHELDQDDYYQDTVYLDFFDDAQEVWFRLKYLD